MTSDNYTFMYNELGIIYHVYRKALFILYDSALTLKISKWRLTRFAMNFLYYIE